MPIYVQLKTDGLGSIDGDVTTSGFENWVEALGLQIPPPPPETETDPSKPVWTGELSITRYSDSASPRIAMAWHSGTKMSVTVDLLWSKDAHPYLSITLVDAIITQVIYSTSSDRPIETITFNFTKITYDVLGQGDDVQNQLPPSAYQCGYNDAHCDH